MSLKELVLKYEELRSVPQGDGVEVPDLWVVATTLQPHIQQAHAAGLDWTSILAIIPMLLGILFPKMPTQFVELIKQILALLTGG